MIDIIASSLVVFQFSFSGIRNMIKSNFLDDLEVAHFMRSTKGHAQLVDKSGYIYNKTKIRRNLQNWECISRQKLKCHARAQTSGLHIVQIKGEHSHPIPDPHHRLK